MLVLSWFKVVVYFFLFLFNHQRASASTELSPQHAIFRPQWLTPVIYDCVPALYVNPQRKQEQEKDQQQQELQKQCSAPAWRRPLSSPFRMARNFCHRATTQFQQTLTLRRGDETTTQSELESMREQMNHLRSELFYLKKKLGFDNDDWQKPLSSKQERKREFDAIGREVEEWAEQLLMENTATDGWKEIFCNPLVRKSFNREGKIKCYLKWLKDSRGKHAKQDDANEYPCIKLFATLDAPMETVCEYLSQESNLPEYNDLVVKHRDLEDISPYSKICWGQCPQILFIKPRDFVTFCHHRWRKDGAQVVVNQAVDHQDAPPTLEEGNGDACRAYAIRGANFISQHPDDPQKTLFSLIAHANPGGGMPRWACKTAVNAVAPIEPFKLFHKINENVKHSASQRLIQEQTFVSSPRSARPGGLSQMGYACFWPDGGGLEDDHNKKEVDDNKEQ